MTILRTAYDTTAATGTSIDKIANLLKTCSLGDGLLESNSFLDKKHNDGDLRILLVVPGHSTSIIPPFAHAIRMPFGPHKREYVFVDMRTIIGTDAATQQLRVRSHDDFAFKMTAGLISAFWTYEEHNPTHLGNFNSLPLKAFATVLSDEISAAYGLSPGQYLRVKAIAALFYYTQFTNLTPAKRDIDRCVLELSRAMSMDGQIFYDIINDENGMEGYIPTIDDFCSVVKKCADANDRLMSFSRLVIYNRLISMWFGPDYNEVVAAAFEYPPLWISIVYAASIENGQRRCKLAKVLQTLDRGQAVHHFQIALADIFGGPKAFDELREANAVLSNWI